MKFHDHIQDRNGRAVLQAIDQPVIEFGSPLEVFARKRSNRSKRSRRT